MLKCGKCGSQIPPNTRFCSACGAAMERPGADIIRIQAEQATKKKSTYWAVAVGLVTVALVLLAVFLGRGRVTEAPAPVLHHAPVVTAAPPGPPEAVVAYIEHVKKIEGLREKMRMDLSPAYAMLKDVEELHADPSEGAEGQTEANVQEGIGVYTRDWQDIVGKFDAVPPPQGCEKLASTYGAALRKYSEVMINIQLAMFKRDLGALMSMRGTAQSDLDNTLVEADKELAGVCKANGIDKTFSITPDNGMTNLFSILP